MSSKKIQSSLTATGIFGIMGTSSLVSFATMVFSKACPDYFGTGLALFLLAGFVTIFLLSRFSSYEGVIGNIQDVPAAISGLIAISLASMLSNPSQEAIFANLFVAMALSSFLTGVCFILLGRFKLGNMVRFIPYPVMGGFLAGTGWLLFKYGLEISTGVSFTLISIGSFIGGVDPVKFLCCLAFGVGVMALRLRYPSNMFIMPGAILGSIFLFWIVATALGFSFDQIAKQGWLLGPMPQGALWQSLALPDLKLVEWSLMLKQSASISTIMILSGISFLLNESGIEFATGKDLDVNKDLYVTGATNVVNCFLGAPVGYIYVSSTTLATSIGANYRAVGAMTGCFFLFVLFAGGTFLSYFPKFVAGGLLFFLGLSMLKEWIIDCRKTIPKIDYGIIVGVVLIVEFIGFLQGVAIGTVAAVIIFVFRYSTINIVKNVMDGTHIRSSKDRPITDQRMLDHHAGELVALQLQGFIFFGTANSLYENVKQLASSADKPIKFVLMDLTLVQGIDSSAVKSFAKLAKYLEKENISLLIVNMSEKMRIIFEADGFTSSNYPTLHEYSDIDHATEYCEDAILLAENEKLEQAKQNGQAVDSGMMQAVYSDMMAALDIQVMFESLTERMKPYLEQMEISERDRLYSQKEISKDIFFIVRGQVTLSRTNREGKSTRIRTLGPWTITGELGAFLGYQSPYDADVVKSGIVQKLSAESRARMEAEDSGLASEFQRLIITMLGNQLMKNQSCGWQH
jgi:SulP family sulfate permease